MIVPSIRSRLYDGFRQTNKDKSRLARAVPSGKNMGKRDLELGQLASGEYVFDRPRSHLHGPVKELLIEAFATIQAQDREVIIEEIDLGRIVGKRHCVETKPDDEIVFARRKHRKGLTRFVIGREPEECSSIVVILKRDEYSDTYFCLSAYIGTHSEPEPWDAYATPESEAFWQTHAMILDADQDT